MSMRVERIVEIAKKYGVDDVVATNVKEIVKQVRFSNNQISISKRYELEGNSVFLAKDKKVIVGTIRSYDDVRRLVEMMKYVNPRKYYYGIAKGGFTYNEIEKYHDESLIGADEIGIVKDAIDHVKGRSAGNLYLREYSILKATSGGIFASDSGTTAEFSIRVFHDKYSSGQSVACSRTLSDLDYLGAVEEANNYAKLSRNPKKGKEGKYDVIFTPLAFGDLLNQVGTALSAFNVDAGFSCFANKIGEVVGSDVVTIIDDGRMENGIGSVLFDEEGVPTKKNVLIENGVLTTYLHNTSTAKKYKTETTGNAGLIAPRPWNIILKEGDYSLDEMIKEVKNGILITNVWYTRFTNYLTGDFSTIPRDAMIEIKDGKLTRPVVELRVSDNLIRILKNVKAISSFSKQVKWWEFEYPAKTGYVLVNNVHLTSPGNV